MSSDSINFGRRLSVNNVHLAMAIGAKRDGIVDRVIPAGRKPSHVVTFKIRDLLVGERRRRKTEVAGTISQAFGVRISRLSSSNSIVACDSDTPRIVSISGRVIGPALRGQHAAVCGLRQAPLSARRSDRVRSERPSHRPAERAHEPGLGN